MISGSKVIGFIPTQNPERALSFYQGVIGLRFVSEDPFAIVMESNGTMVRLVHTEEFTPAPYTILGWQVDDIDTTVKQFITKGLLFNRYPFLQQNEDGIWIAPEGAKVAWFHDPDGNTLSFSQH